MSDIVERLRDKHCCDNGCHCDEAANEIESLRFQLNGVMKMRNEAEAEIEKLRAALETIDHGWENPMDDKAWRALAQFMWKTARAALAEEKS